jgi:DUF2075 family protein
MPETGPAHGTSRVTAKWAKPPPAALWASEPNGFDQVGCVYPAQGFEYDWSGVITGPDLVWRDGRFTRVRGANKDPTFRNRKTVTAF